MCQMAMKRGLQYFEKLFIVGDLPKKDINLD